MSVHTVWTTDSCGPWDNIRARLVGGHVTSEDASRPGGDAVVDPVAALRRIAFLLERRMADSYRIKAYRGAAAAILRLDPEEVRTRARAGTLRDLPGVGAKTAAIVAECVAGDVPGYFTELEATAGPLAD